MYYQSVNILNNVLIPIIIIIITITIIIID